MSGKRQRTFSLIITAVVIALMAVIYFMQIRKTPDELPGEESVSASVNLINRDENEVAQISYLSADGERTLLTPRIDAAGSIQWAYSAAEDYILLQHLIYDKARPAWIITAVNTAHEDSAALELADFGLEPPVLTVETVFYDGSGHTLKLGVRTTDLQYYFLMVDDDPAIYLITAVLGDRLQYGAAEMLDMSLPYIDLEEAAYIRIAERGRDEIILALRDENAAVSPLEGLQDIGGEQLIMYAPLPGMPISTSRLIEYVISPILQLRLNELADLNPSNLAQYGLDAPVLEFEFNQIHWLFGASFSRGGEELIYIKTADRPHVFITEARHIESVLGLDALNIAERFLALVPITDVESITIEYEIDYRLVMNHIAGIYEIEPTVNGIPVNDDNFRRMYARIIALIADSDVEPFTPTGEPELTITHHRIENADTQIRFFNYNANFFAVSVDGGDVTFVTNRRAVGRLFEYIEGLISTD